VLADHMLRHRAQNPAAIGLPRTPAEMTNRHITPV